jgi:outer membrane protein TolC
MIHIRSLTAILCALLIVTPAATAQSVSIVKPYEGRGFLDRFKKNYMEREVAPIRLNNSARLDSLLRAGKLYLSLRDAVALALENNLDIELQRYGPEIAKASLMRAEAGGLLRGVPPTVQQGAASAQNLVLGSQTGGAPTAGGGGQQGGGQQGGGGNTGGTVITTTGTAFQNLDPVFVSTFNAGHTTRPQSNTVTTGLTANVFDNISHSYSLTKSWLSGTTTSFGWNNTRARGNNPLSDINPFDSANFQLQISQRLLQGFGVAVNNRNIRIAKNNVTATELQFKQQVIVTVAAVVNLYWDLVSFNEDLNVKKQALALAEKLYEDNKKQVEIGTLAPIEIVSAEAQVARRQQELTQAETLVIQQETILKNALSRNGVASPAVAEASIIPTDRIRMEDAGAGRPLSALVDAALQKRPDLAQTRINIENAKIGLKGSQSQLLPSLDLQASFQNNGLSGQVNSLPVRGGFMRQVDPFFLGGFGSVLEQVIRRNFPDYSVGFQLNIPIKNRSAQADMILDQLSIRQSELNQQKQINQVRVDVQNAMVALTQARARYQAAVKEKILQEQTLDAEQKKYALGASTVFFVIQYQRDLAQAQSNEVAAQAAYAKARNDLERVTAETLEVHNIEIAEAMAGNVSRAPAVLPPAR